MGTFHSFVSEPLKKSEAQILFDAVSKICDEGDRITIVEFGHYNLVVGILKNLGGPLVQLMKEDTGFNWATVSDEGDFLNTGT